MFFREITEARRDEFVNKGVKARYFFPHRLYYLPKCGPDGFASAERLFPDAVPNQLWQVVLYAAPSAIADLPPELFFDDDIIWHQQHLGRAGLVATANLVLRGDTLYTNNHLSDLVQRISRRRELKSRIENRFKGWNHMLLNGILNFAVERNLKRILMPTAELVVSMTDPKRRQTLNRELFDRIYDHHVCAYFRAERAGLWWAIDVPQHRDRLVEPVKNQVGSSTKSKTICIYHDVERGIGHAGIDPQLEAYANTNASQALEEMLSVERRVGIRATYSAVGIFLPDVRASIAKDGHCIAFHTFDHRIGAGAAHQFGQFLESRALGGRRRYARMMRKAMRWLLPAAPRGAVSQLEACRRIDYRVKGYHPCQSALTPKSIDANLCYYNFEWLALPAERVGSQAPHVENRVVKIPVQLDDCGLYYHRVEYQNWEQLVLKAIEENELVVLGLHDCYSQYWLPGYCKMLERICQWGTFKTLDQLAAETFLASAE